MSGRLDPERLKADPEERLASGRYDDELLAASEGRRVRALSAKVRGKMLRLSIWCESGQCRVGRVFVVGNRLLLELASPENTEWLGKGVGRNYVGYWLDAARPKVFSFTCRCINGTSRRIRRSALQGLLEDQTVRNTPVIPLLEPGD